MLPGNEYKNFIPNATELMNFPNTITKTERELINISTAIQTCALRGEKYTIVSISNGCISEILNIMEDKGYVIYEITLETYNSLFDESREKNFIKSLLNIPNIITSLYKISWEESKS